MPQRLFLAVHLPDAVRDAVERVGREASALGPGIRPVRREGLHLTLRFLGDTETDRIPGLRDAVLRAVGAQSAFSVSLGGSGVFPSVRRPSVFWVGTTGGATELGLLHSAVEEAVRTVGFAADSRGFSAHVTVARVGRGTRVSVERLSRFLASRAGAPYGTFRVSGVTLYASDLRPGGAVYRSLAEFPLGRGQA